MEGYKKILYVGIIIVHGLLFPFLGYSQNSLPNDSINSVIIVAAREIAKDAATCTLITVDEDGVARARAMDAFEPEEDFVIWFGTNPNSRKVGQIQHHPLVSMYYFDKKTSSYVLLHGKAEIVDDAKEKEKHWKQEWQAFYPNYPKEYLLIKVVPIWMEVVSESRGIVGDPTTWQPAIVRFNKN